jgi:alpha-tubulin suppressor-like RCC1 family protein
MKCIFFFTCLTFLCFQAFADSVTLSGSLWGMGSDGDGQLGETNITTEGTPVPVEIIPTNVTAVAAGYFHSLWIESDGSLWGVGAESSGQLGNGTYGADSSGYINVPVEIVSNGVVAVSAGYDFSLFLKSDGSLWGMGDETVGELGNGVISVPYYVTTTTNVPVEIEPGGVVAISATYQHSMFLKSDGSLWVMGDNLYYELGNNTQNDSDVPLEIESSNVVAISAGQEFSLFIKSDGSLWGMGENTSGQLGLGSSSAQIKIPTEIETNGVTAISAGGASSMFTRSDGSLWTMGNNGFGQLGDGTTSNTNRPEEIETNGVAIISFGDQSALFVKTDGSLWAMGAAGYGQLGDGNYGGALEYITPPIEITNGVAAIAAAYSDSLFIKGIATQPPGYNQITFQLTTYGSLQLSYLGTAGNMYALDYTTSLSWPIDWIPQVTNTANANGVAIFPTTPNPQTGNFWRVRLVP